MNKLKLFSLLAAATLFVSCRLSPKSSGNPYEVMVVASDSVWNGYAGRALQEVLNKPMPMLPQEEPTFHVSHVEEKHYDRVTNLFRNIVIIDVNHTYSRVKYELQYDLFSSPQLVLTIHGPSEEAISISITQHTKYLINLFQNEELNREAQRLEDHHNIEFAKKVEEMFG